MDVLTFELERQVHAFRADHVIQVVQMVEIAPLPGAPAVIEGIVNVRGTIVPVFDIRSRLGLPASAIDPRQHLIILSSGKRASAVRVDSAEDFVTVSDADITKSTSLAESGVRGVSPRHVAGIAATADGTTIIYDVGSFLSPSESEALDSALGAARG